MRGTVSLPNKTTTLLSIINIDTVIIFNCNSLLNMCWYNTNSARSSAYAGHITLVLPTTTPYSLVLGFVTQSFMKSGTKASIKAHLGVPPFLHGTIDENAPLLKPPIKKCYAFCNILYDLCRNPVTCSLYKNTSNTHLLWTIAPNISSII